MDNAGLTVSLLLKKVLNWVRWLFALFAIGCLLYFGGQSRDLLAVIISGALPGYLLLAVLLWILMHLLAPLFSVMVFSACGSPITFRQALEIHITNLPARYIPGGIWHTVGRVIGYRRQGVTPGNLAVFVFLENVLAVAIAFLIGGTIIFYFRGMTDWGEMAALSAIFGFIVLVLTPFMLNLRLRNAQRSFLPGEYILSSAVIAISWCVGAGAFAAYLSAFPGVSQHSSLLEVGGAYLFSWAVGFIAVFAPQGVGVFELVASDLLRGAFSHGGLAALLAGFRIIIFLADLVTWLAGRLLLPTRAS